MERIAACVTALAFAAVLVGARAPVAQTTPGLLDACEPGEPEIQAASLPEAVGPDECPVEGRIIVDGAVESVVPSPGRGIHAEVLTTSGAQELEVERLFDGTIKLEHVGDDSGPADEGLPTGDLKAAAGGDGCGDTAYDDLGYRVEGVLPYRVNEGTTPPKLSRRDATNAIRRAANNISGTRNACALGDRNPSGMDFEGNTTRYPDRVGRSCTQSDGLSVVAFGDLPVRSTLAVTCTYYSIQPGYDAVDISDVKINRGDFRWTTNPNAPSCKSTYDLESVMTHERGHTFGLGHVAEGPHPDLTMGPNVNGPCQDSERTLGRGDVLGLDNKHP